MCVPHGYAGVARGSPAAPCLSAVQRQQAAAGGAAGPQVACNAVQPGSALALHPSAVALWPKCSGSMLLPFAFACTQGMLPSARPMLYRPCVALTVTQVTGACVRCSIVWLARLARTRGALPLRPDAAVAWERCAGDGLAASPSAASSSMPPEADSPSALT
jgi:hypothetical protein